jgi:uncharacterized protein (TIGR02453 family)
VAFRGWPAEAVEFFEGLEADNSKAYWQAHKHVYDQAVRAPMDELVAELAVEFGEGRVFRPYRDVRFSADKTPYKTRIYAGFRGGGYVQFSADGLAAARGYYQMAPDQLERYRRAVADDGSGAELAHVVDEIEAAGVEVIGHGSLKTVPRGYPKDHPRADLLRHKGLTTWKHWPTAAWMGTKAAKTRVEGVLRTSQPLQGWLDRHVGPSTSEH